MHELKTSLDWALYYRSIGWSVFPVAKGGKTPIVEWKKYQTEIASEEEIKELWTKYPDANIGVVTGKISGLVVLDLDSKHGRTSKEFKIPPTVCAKSGGLGEHFFFKYSGDSVQSSNGQIFGVGVDLKANGGYIVLTPSLHESGRCYEWIIGPKEIEKAEMPEWLKEAIEKHDKKDIKLWQKEDGAKEGNRNETAISVAGKLRSSLPVELRESLGWAGLVAHNNKSDKPLSEKELTDVWESAKKYDSIDDVRNKGNQVENLIKIISCKENTTLFHDSEGKAYLSVKIGDHHEIMALRGKNIKKWFYSEYWNTYNKAINNESLMNTIGVLEGGACCKGSLFKLHDRLAWNEDNLWYDLTNDKWQAIKINSNGWEVVNEPPILFSRRPHNKPQFIPSSSGGDINLIFKYINIINPEQKLLLMTYLISCFIPDFAHPILIIVGQQGSAKSTLSKLLRHIVDPSQIEVASMPDNHKELVQALAHHTFLFFDNVSRISESVSDILCKATTGSGFIKREMYLDDDDIIYSLKRCIGINSINLVSTRPDLLDRSLIIELDRIDPDKRKTDKEIMDSFEKDLPLILGGIFDVLSKVLKIKSTIKLTKLPRMADFALWGSAIAEVVGYTQEKFISAYQNNINKQNETVLNENIVSTVLIAYMTKRLWKKWEGTASDLLVELNNHATLMQVNTYNNQWPKVASTLSHALNTLKTTLRDANIIVNSYGGQTRKITIEKILPKTIIKPVIETLPCKDGIDDIDGVSETIKEITPKEVVL